MFFSFVTSGGGFDDTRFIIAIILLCCWGFIVCKFDIDEKKLDKVAKYILIGLFAVFPIFAIYLLWDFEGWQYKLPLIAMFLLLFRIAFSLYINDSTINIVFYYILFLASAAYCISGALR